VTAPLGTAWAPSWEAVTCLRERPRRPRWPTWLPSTWTAGWLAGYAAAAGLIYSRYADDLTFSGPEVAAPRLIRAVTEIARDEGFAINTRKTRAQQPSRRRTVTGLVVSGDRSGVPRNYHDRLRAVLHDAAVNGPAAANRAGLPHFRDHLEGQVGWVESVNAVRGRRLRAQLEAISWPG
jgi:RNA-directed DNA polymerase